MDVSFQGCKPGRECTAHYNLVLYTLGLRIALAL